MALQESPLTLKGGKTPKVVIYKSESQKLHQAFTVHQDSTTHEYDTIIKGQPVKINTDGTISPYKGTGAYIGIAVTDSINPCYKPQYGFPMEVTVMVEGFAIIECAASGSLDAGYVIPADANPVNNRYVVVSQSTETVESTVQPKESNFIALQTATAANDLVKVLVK
jgi:hypothetical protein